MVFMGKARKKMVTIGMQIVGSEKILSMVQPSARWKEMGERGETSKEQGFQVNWVKQIVIVYVEVKRICIYFSGFYNTH